MTPARQITVPTDSEPPTDVILADYESTGSLANCVPQWTRWLIVFSNCNSEAQICSALERGARRYILHGTSVSELIDAVRSVRAGGLR
jgi:DNA-binding NarL/FixJ family response regulator